SRALESHSLVEDFFFQAEDGIRDRTVTGVQTCALPIFTRRLVARRAVRAGCRRRPSGAAGRAAGPGRAQPGAVGRDRAPPVLARSEERRVGKECRCQWSTGELNRDETVERQIPAAAMQM